MAELFENFEVGREARWPTVLRLLGGSVVLHLALIAGVVYIPPVRDALNIAALIARSNYVDKPYARTVFGQDIQMVQAAPKFQYPPGYFAVGLPQPSPSPTVDPNAPRIISEARPLKPESSPSPSPSPSVAASPSPVIAQANGPAVGQEGGDKKGASAGDAKAAGQKTTPAEQAKTDEAQKQMEQAAAANNVELPEEINRQPIKDLTAYANNLKNEGQLDLNKSFEVSLDAELDANGKLNNPTITQKSGDPKLSDLATRAVGALNESGLLIYLKSLNNGKPTKVTFTISQDSDSLVAKLESELGSEENAKQQAGAFSILIALGQKARAGKDEEALLKNTKAVSDGKKLVFHFSIPRQIVVDMIKKQLASNAAKQG